MSTRFVAMAVDPASGLSSRADYFAITTGLAEVETRRIYLLDAYRGRHETTEQPHIVLREYQKWMNPPHGATFYRVGIETVLGQVDLFNHLRRDNLVPIKEIPRRSGAGSIGMSKYLRLLGLAGRYERGQIYHPDDNPPWLEDFETELLSINYVNGKETHAHDDMCDSWASCVELLAAVLLAQSRPAEPQYSTFSYG